LICGGDGSVGWVLTAIDKLGLTNKCQVGILPLGTGNDLARVLGWGSTCDDNSQLPHILNELESSGFKMLDRWSIQTKPISPPSTVIRRKLSALPPVFDKKVERRISVSSQEAVATAKLEKSVASHLAVILSEESRDYDVIDSTRFLCEHIQTFVTSVCEQKDEKESCTGDKILREKCHLLNEKLESLMSTLQQESQSSLVHPVMEQSSSVESTDGDSSGDYDDMVRKLANIMHQPVINGKEERQKELEVSNEPVLGIKPELKSKVFRSRDAVMARANSLKKAVKQIIEHAEEALNQQVNEQITQSALIHNNPTAVGTGDEGIGTGNGTTTVTSDHDNELSTEEDPMPSSRRTSGASDAFEDAATVIQNEALLAEKEVGQEKGLKKKKKKRRKVKRARFTSFDSGLGSSIVSRKSKYVVPNTVLSTERFMPNLSAALLVGANALVAPVTAPATFEEKQIPELALTGYSEVNVMNNYFGIGLDAKISLDFHNKREEHPERCRNRMLNRMWYGMLGGKQFISQTYKNLDQRVKLECDGKPVQLPTIQGIVVLNIPR
jgi:diacylglycerol kinase (ATP)